MKRSLLFSALFFMSVNAVAEYGRLCGEDAGTGDKICFRYHPTRLLEVTEKNGVSRTEYPMAKASATTKYEGDLTITTYQFEPAEAGKTLVYTSRVIEAPRYPGDGEWEVISLEGTTPGRHSEKFSVKLPK